MKYKFILESVSTNPDECKDVGPEISTGSKRKTTINLVEDIVSAYGNIGYNMCRTANGWDINGLGQLKDGRGNICPVTILMPFIAMEAVKDVNEQNRGCMVPQSIEWYQDRVVEAFMEKLDNKIHEAKDMLLERFEWICAQDPSSANFMWDNHTMAGYVPEEGIRSALKHGTIVIGQLGLAETLQILIGCDHTEKRGMELAKKIEQLFKDRCAEFKKEWHNIKDKPEEKEIKAAMINKLEQQLCRKLTIEELNEINNYTPAEKIC